MYAVRPPMRPYWLHILLFLLTVLTTLIVGARLQENFAAGDSLFLADNYFFPLTILWRNPRALLDGVPFAATLLGILMTHEMGHFVWSVKHRVYATLPFFLPFPSPIGTFGAFIKIQSPFRSRAALLDIGIAGPIAGFIVAVPMAVFGLALSQPAGPNFDSTSQISTPLIFNLLHWVLGIANIGHASQASLQFTAFHPVALAAWVGMLATALNLLPGGQLDGGHILFSVNPEAHRNLTWMSIVVLVPLTLFFWSGWLIWILALFFTRRHPSVPAWPDLDVPRRRLLIVAAAILLLTFMPTPIPGGGLWDSLKGLHL